MSSLSPSSEPAASIDSVAGVQESGSQSSTGGHSSAGGRGDDARQRLLAAAGPVFAKHGFDRATVREICTQAGVNVASVGYYFGDKLGLYREVFRMIRVHYPTTDDGDPVIAAEPAADKRLFMIVHRLLTGMLARDNTGWESQLMMREMNHPTEVFSEMVQESFRPNLERLIAALGELSADDTPVHVLEQLALSVVGQCLYYRVGAEVVKLLIPAERLAQHFSVQTLACHITAVILSAVQDGLSLQHRQRCLEFAATLPSMSQR